MIKSSLSDVVVEAHCVGPMLLMKRLICESEMGLLSDCSGCCWPELRTVAGLLIELVVSQPHVDRQSVELALDVLLVDHKQLMLWKS